MTLPKSLISRFWPKVKILSQNECWPWTAGKRRGYGRIVSSAPDRQIFYAHRIAYELLIGAIPPGLELHHKCENRACCNPLHLQLMPHGEHTRMHNSVAPRKTHCLRGHRLAAGNLYFFKNGDRACKICVLEKGRRRYYGFRA
jgi:hypothetical protein